MILRKRHIILTMFLLLLSSGMNKAWADVTYIILTKPFNVQNYQDNAVFRTNVRVEALRCTSDGTTVYLPDAFRSPLATNFTYYTGATSTYASLYDTGHDTWILATKYDIYTDVTGVVSEGSPVGANTTFYVTYDYINDNHDSGWRNGIIELDGTKNYTVTLNKGSNLKYLCYNRSRNNRPAAANASSKDKNNNELFTGERLVNDKFENYGDYSTGFKWDSYGPRDLYFQFKFEGSDPYNVVIKTAYNGNETYNEYLAKEGTSATYMKPYRDAAIFSKINNNSTTDKLATEEKMWLAVDHNKHYKSKVEISADNWPGFYRGDLDPVFNAFAILPHSSGDGYVLMASKMNVNGKNHQPNGDGNYVYMMDNNYNPSMYFKAANKTVTTHIYEIREYTFKVRSPLSNTELSATIKWSDAKASENILNHIPEAIKRKYVNFTGAYKEEAHTNSLTTFADALAANNGNVIWLDYSVSDNLPFDVLAPVGGSYDYKDARWYTIRMNGKAEQQNIAYNSSNQFITGSTSIGSTSNLHTGENSADAQVAFIGDPFEMKIISRAASEAANDERYIGCVTSAENGDGLNTNMTGSSDISSWEIVYESTDVGNFVLRQFNTVADPKYIGWDNTSTNHPVVYSTAAYTDKNRIRVVELDKVPYTYYIKRTNTAAISAAGEIAVKAKVYQDVGTMLRTWLDIPEIIRSPFLKDATVTYKDSGGNVITNAPYSATGGDIYVTYSLSLSGSTFNVILNNDYIYTSGDAINSQGSINSTEAGEPEYQWTLDYSDPYSMTIKNVGKNQYVNIASWADKATIGWSSDTPSFFVAKSGAQANTYEVMAATGTTVDASETYYNIGRPAANTVKLYSNATYLRGNQILRFQLIGTSATDITYHLIDMAGNDLLKAVIRQTTEDKPAFPPEYQSPLVSKYYYHTTEAHATANRTSGDMADDANIGAAIADIYVTYDVNDLVNLKRGKLYRLKYEAGQYFNQEDGSDGVNLTAQKAFYPYVNGDCNFFIYGEEQFEIQRHASSTRTRWVWYLQSDLGEKGDPYHVKIRSFQSESYPITNPSEYNAFFATYKPEGYDKVVTTLVFPGISGERETEYMVLGSEGQYQLVTTNTIPIDLNNDGDYDEEGESNVRHTVNSFEQYWKTFDTIKKKILNAGSETTGDDPQIIVPGNSYSYTYNGETKEGTYRSYLEDIYGWHSYEKWAYAKRWNGYNNGYSSTVGTPETKKGWEKIEHWYQTVNMGQGYFDFVETSIDPVLVLLDQHGWEIMRKPLPTSPDDPEKEAKYEAIRPYNSPMVKEYAFWATQKKRTGFHQYYLLSDRIGGDDFTSTDLTNLPPYNSKNVKDKKGNLNDQYVTYIVKDEYAQSYNPNGNVALPFLIEQGINHKYATTNAEGTTLNASNIPHNGDMKAHILNDDIFNTELWYVRPNANIDDEMGYSDAAHNWDVKTPNGYADSKYNTLRTSVYVKETDEYLIADATTQKALTDKYGQFSFSNGFDPYNIQISPVDHVSQFMKTNASEAILDNGYMSGGYYDTSTNPATPITPAISIGATTPMTPAAKWYDSRNLAITNATWMAVQDANGNIQLMPRFDNDLRMSEFGTLIAPTDANVASTYTKFYRPEVYTYIIIDNDGHESLRYKTGGDLLPQTPDHFKSPLAKEFKYYTNAHKNDAVASSEEEWNSAETIKRKTATDETDMNTQIASLSVQGDYFFRIGTTTAYTYKKVTIGDEITESLDGATLNNNTVYVRYEYDENADNLHILKGNWLTMKLNNLDAKYDSGIKQGTDKPTTIDGTVGNKAWQWKFLETPQSTPDPYAVYLFNRSQVGTKQANGARFTLLSHTSGDYALAKAGKGDFTYDFLNANGEMTDSKAAEITTEAGFTPSAGIFSGTKSQVKLTDEVEHTFTYKVYTNGGVLAIEANQEQAVVTGNDWKPELPEAAQTPLLNAEHYRYYEHTLANGSMVEADTLHKALPLLYGLYDDIVYTHYTPYNDKESGYLVPNVRNAKGSNNDPVVRGGGSNDAPLGLDGKRPYNIIWLPDNMMKNSGTTIASEADKDLQSAAAYEWELEGDDPYAIKIKSVGANGYIKKADSSNSCDLSGTSTTATTFMILNRDGYDYGVLAKTGDKNTMLSEFGNTLTNDNPTKFIIFALSTFKVIYHLVIANINNSESIPYAELDKDGNRVAKDDKVIAGSTERDLTSTKETSGDLIAGDKYQLGGSLPAIIKLINSGITTGLVQRQKIYCWDAGHVSLGDALEVPSVFYRPNVNYDFYIEGVYDNRGENEITEMNNKYKGLKVDKMEEDGGLLGKIVLVNIVYSFMGGLETNAGTGFVTAPSQNKWYTFETSGATPRLAQNTGTLQTQSGYATHYTNDYLWTPVGDPYGFKMYNRYEYKNLGSEKVMTTAAVPTSDNPNPEASTLVVSMNTDDDAKSIYELLATNTTTPGYFRVHPVFNNSGVQYYMRDDNGVMKLSLTPTEWTFGLSEDVMRPYNEGAGYVGGLNAKGKAEYDKADDEATEFDRLIKIQDVVYNHDLADDNPDNYIVHFAPGYYRLHNQPGSLGISTPRYASGYTHAIERDLNKDNNEADAIPMHFYEQTEYSFDNPVFNDLKANSNDDLNTYLTKTAATQGDIPLATVAYDPASIFRFTGTTSGATMSTQGLNVVGNKMTTGAGTSFAITDIGGAIVALNNGNNYLSYKQDNPKFDLKYGPYADESARWCMQPVQKSETAGYGEMELRVATHNGNDGYYYTTFCAPFDVLLTNATNDKAYVVPSGKWNADILYPEAIGQYNTGTYAKNDQFVPAGTPVIIRTKSTTGYVTLALPTASPASTPVSCAFSGKYLEQMLDYGEDFVYVFGRPYTGTFRPADDFNTTGVIEASAPAEGQGVGFYKNANYEREHSEFKPWRHNNKYVYANKIYYRAGSSGASSRNATRGIDFIPVVFDRDEDDEEMPGEGLESGKRMGDNRIYDMKGRCVAAEQQVKEGNWRNLLAPGIYILNGKKFMHQNHTGR